MNDVNAVIGQNNYPHSLTNVEKHRENGQYFNTTLQNIPGITLLEQKDDRTSSYWLYTLRVENRNDFTNKMKEHGITTSLVHDRNDKHPCLKEYACSLPGTDTICQDMICIPCGWWVTNEDREYITECIKGGW
jgi:dTDP-4-amino-4,6-dideoxygalactose transaminase